MSFDPSPSSPAQVPGAEGARHLEPLERARQEHERRRRRLALVAVVLITPGLALPLLGKRGRRARARTETRPAEIIEACRDACAEAFEARGLDLKRWPRAWSRCTEQCLAAQP